MTDMHALSGHTSDCPDAGSERGGLRIPLLVSLGVVLLALAAVGALYADEPTPEDLEFFEKKVRPVLVEHCYRCHSHEAKKPKGGLLLDSRAAMLKGGDNGPALVPGHPEKSRLIQAITYRDVDLQMPPKGKLPESAIADLTAWVKKGAVWPKTTVAKKAGTSYTFDLIQRKQEHWSWRPLHTPKPPPVKNTSWPRSPVDQFLLARLEEKGLAPAADAARETLLRRLYFDLVGLPPSPEEVEAFVRDTNADAVEKVVDRLLASPHFGERWARHWLDLVRYGESRGHEFDYTNPNAFQYRDYVIRALNADVPYHQFVLEHLAGDLLPQPRLHPTEKFNESILGTGFWFLGEQVHSPVDTCQDKADRFDNMLDVMTKTFLGLTVSCARCHDHKFDAISSKDYYALFGFLESSSYRLVPFDALEHNKKVAREIWKLRDQARSASAKELAAAAQPGLERLADHLRACCDVLGSRLTVEKSAAQHKVDAKRLQKWLDHLAAAGKDPLNPFHAFARIAVDEAARLTLLKAGQENSAQAEAALKKVQVVIDYRKAAPNDWIPDGVVFGMRPVQPGDLVLDDTGPRFHEQAAAVADPELDVCRPAPGAENDPGALGGVFRAGRTLRTPTFTLDTGRVYCLVRGAGMIYASVDGHVMIAGPLHGQMVNRFKAPSGYQWVALDLTRYKGRRTHLEFTPAVGASLAVALVVQGETPPGSLERPGAALLDIVDRSKTPAALASAYQTLLTDVVAALAVDKLAERSLGSEYAALANWLAHNIDLLGDSGAAWTKHLEGTRTQIAALKKSLKTDSRLALAILDGSGVDERVFIRGNYKTPGEPAPRRFLEALAGEAPLPISKGSGRLELARLMIDSSKDPYLPRVLVNRLWHHLFGRGLVASVDNFGVLGEAPTHPELLDYLATQFVEDGWSIKKMIRRLVLTRAYQMASAPNPEAAKLDPGNLLLHRARIRRLEGEAIRDAMLQISGRLDTKMFGPSVPVYLTEFQQGRGRPASGPLDGNGRRSIYLSVRRNFLPSFLLAFDTPIPFSTVGRRTVSNVPAQALILLNDPFVHQQADLWAKKVQSQAGDPAERLRTMYLAVFGRPPTQAEVAACLEFLGDGAQPVAWKNLAHVLFNAKEFIFLQ